jgi:hypothetical protein
MFIYLTYGNRTIQAWFCRAGIDDAVPGALMVAAAQQAEYLLPA